MIQRPGFISVFFVFLLTLAGCAQRRVAVPEYSQFLTTRRQIVPTGVLEIYGHYAARSSDRTFRSDFNLLLDPGRSAYMEIVEPGGRLRYAVSIDQQDISLLWAADRNYVSEKATPENMNAIAGLPIFPDDLLLLVGGYGLNFPAWQLQGTGKSGWNLSRPPFQAQVSMQENLSEIKISGEQSPVTITRYDHYRLVDNSSLPARIQFEIPTSHITIALEIEKLVARDEPASKELFALKLPEQAQRLSLHDIYHGKPLLLQ